MIRQISWMAVIPQVIALALAITVGEYLTPAKPMNGMMWGAAAYLLYSFGSRRLIPRNHRTGVSLSRQQRFAEAIPHFQRSLEFFDRYDWMDRYRSIVLMSPSAVSYREMALANIAFFYSQIGEGEQARSYYEKCLERFPESGLALTALRMMDAAREMPPES
ncbi:MAG: tetratricopeptide repeat protein [Planctomycetales bacterium]|nr:tetratricopeptide repeat protein [Planctomycetales bacterium]